MSTGFDFDRPLLLDGGTGRELLKRGVPILTEIWSATALLLAPEIVRQVHDDFIAAGADIITTNTYGISRERMAREGIEERTAELTDIAGRIAAEARDAAPRPVAVAGSLPPFSGSYRPDKVGTFEHLVPLYREQAAVLAPHVDLYICETMSSAAEGLAAATAAVEFGKPVWVAWTLHEDRSGRLRSGETVAEAVAAIAHLPIAGFLANCCAPESISAAMPDLVAVAKGRQIGGYANTFLPVSTDWGAYSKGKHDATDWKAYAAQALPLRDDLSPEVFAGHAEGWHRCGATVIGGCCGAGPEHIARLRSVLDAGMGKPAW
ncbi:MAG TPA: homocysteine S-methyltransferase family protein [Reyranella sp.]|jgi:S-methylmethionine-dependent homocysteine/selenocysteine methylase